MQAADGADWSHQGYGELEEGSACRQRSGLSSEKQACLSNQHGADRSH